MDAPDSRSSWRSDEPESKEYRRSKQAKYREELALQIANQQLFKDRIKQYDKYSS